MGVEEDPFSGKTNANTRHTWKGAFKIALLKQAIADKIYERPLSNAKRSEQWASLANNLRTGEHSEFFEGMSERSVQDKLSTLLKDYNKKKLGHSEKRIEQITSRH